MNDSLETLLADGIIDAVLGQLKTGKEAEVWLVQHAGQVVAAKLYKERHARNFRNNAGYREGREVRNSRTRRAMEKGTRFGQSASEEAWKSAEANSLYTLHAQGVRVPAPVMFYEGVLLMELVLDEDGRPAPRLVEAPPATAEQAHALYLDLRSQVVRMLSADLIHGDLSPYNVLMGAAGPTVIDFPQTIAAARNNRAEFYFRRDLDNVRNFLVAFAPRLQSMAGDTGEIWNAYVRRELTPQYVPSGTWREAPRRGGPPARGDSAGPREGRPGFRPERAQGNERQPDFRSERPPRQRTEAPAEAPTESPPLDPVEAELRALEATVLRQGGGERGKPAAVAPQRGERRRPPGSGRPPGPGAPRPPTSEQRGGSAPRPPGGERRGSGPPRPPVGEQRGNGSPRPPAGEQRGSGPPRPPVGEQRGNGSPRPPAGEQRGSGPPRPPVGEQRSTGSPRPPRGERPGNGASRPAPVVETRPARGTPPSAPRGGSGPRGQRPARPAGAGGFRRHRDPSGT
jgi:RIO kinase 1